MGSDRNLLTGFGAFEDTDISKRIKEVREKMREEWTDE